MNGAGRGRRVPAAPLLLLGLVLLALVVAMSIVFAARIRATDAYAERALVTEDRLSDLFSVMREAENGLRGYLITGSPISLNTYNQALTAAPGELAALQDGLQNGDEASQLPQINELARQKLAQLEQTKVRLQAGDKAGAAAEIKTDLNLGTMVRLRTIVEQLRADEERRFAEAEAQSDRNGWILESAVGLAVLGTILLAVFAIRFSQAQTRELEAAGAALEQKVAERTATLVASEARFRILCEAMQGLVYMTDPVGFTTYVNPQCSEYTGLAPSEIIGGGWAGMMHPDDIEPAREGWRQSIATGTEYEGEHRLLRHDGAARWFLVRVAPLHDAEGVITAWIGTATDIHDRMTAEVMMANANAALEQRVAERSAELDQIFRLSTDILTISRLDGKFFSVSPAWERVTGFSVAEATSRPYIEFLHPDDFEPTMAARVKLHSGQPASVENRYRRADGSWCWLSWRSVPRLEEGLIYGIARDITAEREREEQLRQSQKMEVVGQLTGGVAHDFNNLLTIIMGSLEMLQRGMTAMDDRTKRRVEAAMEGCRRAAALTHRLLAFSRQQPLAPRALDVNKLLSLMSDMLHRTLGEPIAVELVMAAGLWPALADANQLENAILNLAVNARDAMPEGGHLSIETLNTYLDESYVHKQPDVRPGQYVLIAVTDTGVGMKPEVAARVFEPFFTTKPAGQGTGLGLAQVYGFIKQSQGHVSIYSEPGEGTTVKLYLPRVRGAAEVPETGGTAAARDQPGQGETVLVVEDEPGVRNFSAEVLADLGYDVLTAGSAAQAMEIIERKPGIRLLFTDVVLGAGMNGRQLADHVLGLRPETIVLFTTGYTRNAIIHHGRLDEGINFIGKPFTATALAEKVARLLEG